MGGAIVSGMKMVRPLLFFQYLMHIFTQCGCDIWSFEAIGNGGSQQTERSAGIVADATEAAEFEAIAAALTRLHLDSIGELDLTTAASGRLLQDLENVGGQDIATSHSQI